MIRTAIIYTGAQYANHYITKLQELQQFLTYEDIAVAAMQEPNSNDRLKLHKSQTIPVSEQTDQ